MRSAHRALVDAANGAPLARLLPAAEVLEAALGPTLLVQELANEQNQATEPIPIRLECPACGELHIDVEEFATKPHHTHACQHCGAVWRPAVVATVGVRFLPGFKNEAPEPRR